MKITDILLKEMDAEAETTRKMLALVPDDKHDWKPHTKSMSMRQLATHVAELPGWVKMALTTDEIDFAKGDYKPTPVNTNKDLTGCFEHNYAEGRAELAKADDKDLMPNWTMRSGDTIYSVQTKGETIRHAFSQTIHHRAQLGVYLRLLDIPLPGSYGPSADTMGDFK